MTSNAENVMLDEIWLAWKGLHYCWANQVSCIILETAFDVIMKKVHCSAVFALIQLWTSDPWEYIDL